MDIRKKWHPSPGRRPIYSKGDAAGFFIEHYYEGNPIRQIAEEHHVANSTLQRLLKRELLETVDSISLGRSGLAGGTNHRNAEIRMLRKVLKNKWYTSDYMRDNIIATLSKDGYHAD